ncbi:hypothetical protein [Mycobacterium simiae]|uniref:hypothetical protein n=1 Tax=Mycobacterium simiae TaxID=1784 RepID=UPI00165F79CD|nr:hypothetical protein [Mycobacterium simiae]
MRNCPNHGISSVGLVLLSMVVEGAFKSVAAGWPDSFAAAGVFVVGSYLADRVR